MALPTIQTRTKPTGGYLKRGYRVICAMGLDPTIQLFEKTTKPPAIDGGDAIDITTQWNDLWRTFWCEKLKTLTPMTFKGAFHPIVYDVLQDFVNADPEDNPNPTSVYFENGDAITFFANCQKFEPDEQAEKVMPEATVTVMPLMCDPTSVSIEETDIVYTPASGSSA